MNDFGILVFGHTRTLFLADVLESLRKQDALSFTHVWLDGHQGIPDVKHKTDLVRRVVDNYPVAAVYPHNGMLGFRKMMIQALISAVTQFRYFLVLEDDCFPTRDAVEIFKRELEIIADDDDVFSVYGHHFLVPDEKEVIPRFQGWGWATTSEKMAPYLSRLIDCYSLTEERYLAFVNEVLSDDVRQRLDVTPPRLPSSTITRFFAWDETLALLTALDGRVHRKTPKRTIYNFGASQDSSRFKNIEYYTKAPFNMVAHTNIWDYF
jgi:hypothetical protein